MIYLFEEASFIHGNDLLSMCGSKFPISKPDMEKHKTTRMLSYIFTAGIFSLFLRNRLRQFQDGQLTDNSNILTQLAQQLLNVQRQEELGQADLSSQQVNVSRAGMSTNETANSRTQVQVDFHVVHRSRVRLHFSH